MKSFMHSNEVLYSKNMRIQTGFTVLLSCIAGFVHRTRLHWRCCRRSGCDCFVQPLLSSIPISIHRGRPPMGVAEAVALVKNDQRVAEGASRHGCVNIKGFISIFASEFFVLAVEYQIPGSKLLRTEAC